MTIRDMPRTLCCVSFAVTGVHARGCQNRGVYLSADNRGVYHHAPNCRCEECEPAVLTYCPPTSTQREARLTLERDELEREVVRLRHELAKYGRCVTCGRYGTDCTCQRLHVSYGCELCLHTPRCTNPFMRDLTCGCCHLLRAACICPPECAS
jgi:hypothetical protein